MAREIVLWCDRHLHVKNEHVPGRERRVGLRRQWWSMDLCEECNGDLTETVAKLVATAGRSVAAPGPIKAPKVAAAGEVGAPRDYEPTAEETAGIEHSLEMRRNGRRKGRPGKYGQDLPCIFCGLTLSDGGNGRHMRSHGWTALGKALGTWCPWCGKNHGSLGAHLARSHADRAIGRMSVTKALLGAHLTDAPFSRLEDVRARGVNVQPLDDVLRNFNA